MNTLKVLSSVFLWFFFNNIYSQTGPGGVGNSTTNGLWLRADNISLSNGSFVSSWTDASGNNNHALSTVGRQPIFLSTSSFNNMPTMRLDGIDDQMIINDANILDGTSGITYFTVVRPNNLDGSTARGILGKRVNSSTAANYAYTWFFYTSNYINLDINTNNDRFNTTPTAYSNSTNYLLQMGFDGSLPTAQRSKMYSAGDLIKTGLENSTSILNSSSNLVLGTLHADDGRYLGADMSEIIQYNYALNNAEQIIVNNYLSAKYNLTLTSSNDLYTQDNAGNGNFDHHVAGIGQASDGTNHTDSRGTGIVRMSNPSALSNDTYLFWGEATKNPTYSFTTNATNYNDQLNSKWRVSKRNNLGTVIVSIDMSSFPASSNTFTTNGTCSNLKLIVDNNADFSSPTSSYNLTKSGNIVTATNVSFTDGDYFTLGYSEQIVWNGSIYFNGSGAANAPNTLDSCKKLIIKSGSTANISTNSHVSEVEIETGAKLNIADGFLLEVENQIVNNGIIDLLGEAQLIQNHTGVNLNSGSGSLKARQQGTTNAFNYNYWSSPVNRSGSWQIGYLEDTAGTLNFTSAADPNPATSPITLSSVWLYRFNGTSGDYNSWIKITPTTNLFPGTGFTMKGSGRVALQEEYIFKGIPNDGAYNIYVTAGTDFLTGNPYPSVLDANQFINDNLGLIDGTLYFWESFTTNNSHYLSNYEGGYAIYNLLSLPLPAVADASGLTSGLGLPSKPAPTQYINVGQGFFTTVTNSGTLTFNNAQRAFARESLGATVYYKNNNSKETIDERPKIWFSFTAPKGQIKTIGLGYDNHATTGYDRGYDAKSYDNLKNDIYWLLNDEPLAIQALPEINLQDNLPLGLKISDVGLYKFSISKMENVPSDLNIYLFDKTQNMYYDLRDSDAQLLLDKGTFDQFSIVFKQEQSLGTTPAEDKNIFLSYDSNMKVLEFHMKEPLVDIESVQIYNTLGQEIINIKNMISKSINIANIPNSVYFLKINSINMQNSKTIKFVKY